ncbi:hypothetical protein Kpho02_00750 [Kitasatospora phosalacinea]|uniref:WXG100 family type VII secretion target n=1 Tax=Kitasatospora phosalacinea TaxID=2065 RepID=A0A9W6Q3C9_9ACTN|nr:hypothetical protein [Kitasatospora phosalacinea]GLW67776.1 hypothetical protein Kpho02_00750 [Kitasatospora phosalacinea]
MSNDEQARRYVEAETPAEPVLADRAVSEQLAEPVLADRLVPQQLAEPVLADRAVPEQLAEPIPFRIGTVMPDSVPAEPLLRATPAEPLQPFLRAEDAPVSGEPTHVVGRPMQVAQDAPVPVQPAHVVGRPVQQGVPASPAAERTAAVKKRGDDAGGAGTGFQVDPEQYRAAVSPMLAAYEQVAELSRSLTAFMSSMEAQNPWGNDDSGKKFAEGSEGYLQYSHSTLTVLKALPDELKNIADGLKAMAAGYQNADENVVNELSGLESTAQLPAAPSLPSTPVTPIISTRPIQSGRH